MEMISFFQYQLLLFPYTIFKVEMPNPLKSPFLVRALTTLRKGKWVGWGCFAKITKLYMLLHLIIYMSNYKL